MGTTHSQDRQEQLACSQGWCSEQVAPPWTPGFLPSWGESSTVCSRWPCSDESGLCSRQGMQSAARERFPKPPSSASAPQGGCGHTGTAMDTQERRKCCLESHNSAYCVSLWQGNAFMRTSNCHRFPEGKEYEIIKGNSNWVLLEAYWTHSPWQLVVREKYSRAGMGKMLPAAKSSPCLLLYKP